MIQKTRKGLFLLPALILMSLIVLIPLVWGITVSLQSWNWAEFGGKDNAQFIGLKNYSTLFSDHFFWNAMVNTLIFSVLALVIELLIGLACALLLNSIKEGSLLFRTSLMFPLMLSDIVVALMWKMLLNPTMGPVNKILMSIGMNNPINWIGNSSIVIPTLALVDVWWQSGNIMLVVLAGLLTIPQSVVDMSMVDGANSFVRFKRIIIPYIMPYVKTALIIRLIDLLRVFTLPWAITGGGPGRASEMMQQYVYTQGMGKYMQMGYSNALAVTFALIVVLIIASISKFWKVEE